jgi:hypothetical protein
MTGAGSDAITVSAVDSRLSSGVKPVLRSAWRTASHSATTMCN